MVFQMHSWGGRLWHLLNTHLHSDPSLRPQKAVLPIARPLAPSALPRLLHVHVLQSCLEPTLASRGSPELLRAGVRRERAQVLFGDFAKTLLLSCASFRKTPACPGLPHTVSGQPLWEWVAVLHGPLPACEIPLRAGAGWQEGPPRSCSLACVGRWRGRQERSEPGLDLGNGAVEWTGLCPPQIREDAGLREGQMRNSESPGVGGGGAWRAVPGSKVAILGRDATPGEAPCAEQEQPPSPLPPAPTASLCPWPTLTGPLQEGPGRGEGSGGYSSPSLPTQGAVRPRWGHRASGQLPPLRPGPAAFLPAPRLQLSELTPVSTCFHRRGSGGAAPFSSVMFLFK